MRIILCILLLVFGSAALRAQSNNKPDSLPPQPQGQQGWVQVPSGTSNPVSSLSFPTQDTAFAYSGPSLRSVDGGVTWQPFTVPANWIFKFIDSKNGYSPGYTTHTAYATHDGGQTWTSADDSDQLVELVCPVTPDTAFLSGSDFVSRTTNGGKSWSTGELNMNNINAIAFADSKHGIVVGNVQPGPFPQHPSPSAGCFTTVDGGVTWVQQYTGAGNPLAGVTYVNLDTLIATGGNGYVSRTIDAGFSWDSIAVPASLGPVCYKGGRILAVGRRGEIFTSLDAGLTWGQEASGVTSDLASIAMLNDSTALAAGVGGVILKTTNGGTDWIQVAPPSSNSLHPEVVELSETPFKAVRYILPQLQHVSVTVFDLLGKPVVELTTHELQTAGVHQLRLPESTARSGTYIVAIQTERYQGHAKFVISK